MLATTFQNATRFYPQIFRSYPHLDKLFALFLICFFIYSWSGLLGGRVPKFSMWRTSIDPIQNSTLGFQEIYALALPGRDDRTKPLLDAAKATNLSITMLDAVRDAEIEQSAWPEEWSDEAHAGGELGCLVSHVRTWNKMISHNISTALIMESDADWDMRIKTIMPRLAEGVKALVDWPFNKPHHTKDLRTEPYGDTWDILWIGHCGSNHEGNIRMYSWNDTSVPPANKEWTFDAGLSPTQHPPGTRSLYQFTRTTCSTAYAITLSGAHKLLHHFRTTNSNLDIHLSSMCSSKVDMTCLGIWPQIITPANTKSNIDHDGGGVSEEERKKEEQVKPGPALQYSARVNAAGVIEQGVGREEWRAEWDTSWGLNKSGEWDLVKPKIVVDGDG